MLEIKIFVLIVTISILSSAVLCSTPQSKSPTFLSALKQTHQDNNILSDFLNQTTLSSRDLQDFGLISFCYCKEDCQKILHVLPNNFSQ